jgi:hypothetical protein
MQASRLPPSEVDFEHAFKLRNMALPLLQAAGAWEEVENYPGKVRSYEQGSLFMLHRTPFQPVPVSQEALAQGVTVMNQRDAARAYGLDVWWDRRKVMSVIWNHGGPLGLVMFKQGPWQQVLAECATPYTEAP